MTRWLCPFIPAKACFVLTSELLRDIPRFMFTARVPLGWLRILDLEQYPRTHNEKKIIQDKSILFLHDGLTGQVNNVFLWHFCKKCSFFFVFMPECDVWEE